MSNPLRPRGLKYTRPLWPSPSSEVCPSSCPLLMMPSSHLILWLPSSSFPAWGTFPMSQLFASDDQYTGVSASAWVLPNSMQDWLPLRLIDLLSLLSKGLSEVFSNTTLWRHQFFGAPPSLGSGSHNHTWPLVRPYSLNYTDLSELSLLFRMLSRIVIAFSPRNKHLVCFCISRTLLLFIIV